MDSYKKNIDQLRTDLINLNNTINLLNDNRQQILKQIENAKNDLVDMHTTCFSRLKTSLQIFMNQP